MPQMTRFEKLSFWGNLWGICKSAVKTSTLTVIVKVKTRKFVQTNIKWYMGETIQSQPDSSDQNDILLTISILDMCNN